MKFPKLFGLVMMMIGTVVQAQVTAYTYQGTLGSDTSNPSFKPGIRGTIQLAEPLGHNLHDAKIPVLSQTFAFAGDETFFVHDEFHFSTDAFGNITEWNFIVQDLSAYGDETITSSNLAGDRIVRYTFGCKDNPSCPQGSYPYYFNSFTSGYGTPTWTKDVELDYEGSASMKGPSVDDPNVTANTLSPLKGRILLTAALAPGMNNAEVFPEAVEFDFAYHSTEFAGSQFKFTTNSLGVITAWEYTVDGTAGHQGRIPEKITSTSGQGDHETIAGEANNYGTGIAGAWSGQPLSIKVLYCSQGGSTYSVGAPSNSISSNVSPNVSGIPSICAIPAKEPTFWYIKTTADGGQTWHWIYTLSTLGLAQ
jgi:hypothetical protein